MAHARDCPHPHRPPTSRHLPPRPQPCPPLSAALLLCLALALLPCPGASPVPSRIARASDRGTGEGDQLGQGGTGAAQAHSPMHTLSGLARGLLELLTSPGFSWRGARRGFPVGEDSREQQQGQQHGVWPGQVARAREGVRTRPGRELRRLTPWAKGAREGRGAMQLRSSTASARTRPLRRRRRSGAPPSSPSPSSPPPSSPAAAVAAAAVSAPPPPAATAAASSRLWGDATPHPSPPHSAFNTPLSSVAGRGPCSSPRTAVTIAVNSLSDILRRTRYPPSTTVFLVLQRSLLLTSPLILGRNFMCTVITARAGTQPTLVAHWSHAPAVTMVNTSNILFANVSLQFGISAASQPCQAPIFSVGAYSDGLTCPAFYIIQSYGIQITSALVFGRIDVFRSVFVRLDNIRATMPANAYNKLFPYESFHTKGVIRMGLTATASNLYASNNVVSNSEVWGHWTLITLHQGAVGVTVKQNHLRNFLFAGVACGDFVSWVFDCHNNYIGHNYIVNPPAWSDGVVNGTTPVDPNNAGIYFHIRWFNPGNWVSCNYVLNQVQCIYLDGVSTGVTVDGGVCVNVDNTAVKLNNGKFNKVSSLVVARSRLYASFITCEYVTNGQLNYPGNRVTRNWEGIRRAFYDTPAINGAYPFMRSICNPVPGAINGSSCNPSGGWTAEMTGKCTGIAYSNDVETFGIGLKQESWRSNTDYVQGCDKIPAVSHINRQVMVNASQPQYLAGFTNPGKGDYGLKSDSALYKLRPKFKACPLASTMRRAVPYATYMADFNMGRPHFFDEVLSFRQDHMCNQAMDTAPQMQ